MTTVWDPITVGSLELKSRFALAPMTRSRANEDGTPGASAKEYYVQRAGLGLLITEGIQPSHEGQGYTNTPGIHTPEQIAGWREITDAVHAAGASIYFQLMHVGSLGHVDNNNHEGPLVSASAVPSGVDIFTAEGMKQASEPVELSKDDIQRVIGDYVHAAKSSIEAGADGVQVHGANGYLINQFLGEESNQRTDEYGGSVENRARFALEVVKAVAAEVGAERTALRISPQAPMGKVHEGEDALAIYSYLATELEKIGISFLDIFYFSGDDTILEAIRANYTGPIALIRAGRSVDQIGDDITAGRSDLAPVGSYALANPDFVERFRAGGPYNQPDPSSFFGGTDAGYIDYPTLAN